MSLKIGKGLGKLLEAAGLAREVPDEQEKAAPADAGESGTGNAAVRTPGPAAKRKGAKTGAGPADESAVPADSKIVEALRSALGRAQSADVYQQFKEHGDALVGFILDDGQRAMAAAKAAKITKAEIETAISFRVKKLDTEVEKMRSEVLAEIRQKLAKGEAELKQVADSVTAKEQELQTLRDRADTLNRQIASARQKVEETKEGIQAAYERLRAEIAAEQELVKRSLK
jgi:vacuolar-type H+-ATPase subunit I/STV1